MSHIREGKAAGNRLCLVGHTQLLHVSNMELSAASRGRLSSQ